MSKKKQQEIIDLYANIMAETKIRILSLDHILLKGCDLPPLLIKEFFYLQFRIICELIALGCLAAHGEIDKAPRLENLWSADQIMKGLQKLNPTYFPIPITIQRNSPNSLHITEVKDGFITKEEFLKFYGTCGDVLHKGNMKKFLKGQMQVQRNFPDLQKHLQKLANLVWNHRIAISESRGIICNMAEPTHNNVECGFTETTHNNENI